MTVRQLGSIMHGATGRMDMNRHLIRSIAAIRAEGGVVLANGDRLVPDAILVGRNAEKIAALARAHGIEFRGTDRNVAPDDENDTLVCDTATQMRAGTAERTGA